MIYHLLRGNILHTTPSITIGILQTADRISCKTSNQHCLCITMFGKKMLYDNVEDNPYVRIFQDNGFLNYKLFYSKRKYLFYILSRNKNDKLIIHGNNEMHFHILTNLLFLLFRKDLVRRTSLICWGNNDFSKGVSWITKLTLGLTRNWTYNRYQNILTLTQGDYQQVKSLYPKAQVRFLPYWSVKKHVLDLTQKQQNHNLKKTKVMVSHSGWSENRILKSFELLSRYVPNITVVCPLCYGDAGYIEKVIAKGKGLFGSDFYYFTDLMPRKEYDNLLKTIDVYVTASLRQTGLVAIYGAFDGGAKVFVTGNLLDSLQNDGYTVFPLNDINEMDFEEFSRPLDICIAQANVDLYNNTHYDGKEFLEGWRKVYED